MWSAKFIYLSLIDILFLPQLLRPVSSSFWLPSIDQTGLVFTFYPYRIKIHRTTQGDNDDRTQPEIDGFGLS